MAARKVPRRRRSKGGGSWRTLAIVLGVVAAGATLGLVAVTVVFAMVESRLPDVPTFEEYARGVPKVSRVLAADGTVVAEFFTERRTLMPPDRIPPLVEHAILAAEDADFRTHEGLSYGGIARAMLVKGSTGSRASKIQLLQ